MSITSITTSNVLENPESCLKEIFVFYSEVLCELDQKYSASLMEQRLKSFVHLLA